jgi:hypothetical protein
LPSALKSGRIAALAHIPVWRDADCPFIGTAPAMETGMQVHIFRGTGRIFGVTADETGANLPADPGPWAPFKAIELHRGEPMPGLDPNACLDDLDQYGFHITDAHLRITDRFL